LNELGIRVITGAGVGADAGSACIWMSRRWRRG